MSFDRQLFLKELGRKSFHMAGCVIPAAYFFVVPREPLAIALFFCVLGAGFLEYMRLRGRDLFRTTFMRPSEDGRPGGYFYASVSLFLSVLLFSKTVAIVAMLFLIFGDAITGLAGAVYFMYIRRKPVDVRNANAGSLANTLRHHKPAALMLLMFIICAAIGLVFYPKLSYIAIIAGGLGAVIADSFPWHIGKYVIDDNLSIPLVAGTLMTLAMLI